MGCDAYFSIYDKTSMLKKEGEDFIEYAEIILSDRDGTMVCYKLNGHEYYFLFQISPNFHDYGDGFPYSKREKKIIEKYTEEQQNEMDEKIEEYSVVFEDELFS